MTRSAEYRQQSVYFQTVRLTEKPTIRPGNLIQTNPKQVTAMVLLDNTTGVDGAKKSDIAKKLPLLPQFLAVTASTAHGFVLDNHWVRHYPGPTN